MRIEFDSSNKLKCAGIKWIPFNNLNDKNECRGKYWTKETIKRTNKVQHLIVHNYSSQGLYDTIEHCHLNVQLKDRITKVIDK